MSALFSEVQLFLYEVCAIDPAHLVSGRGHHMPHHRQRLTFWSVPGAVAGIVIFVNRFAHLVAADMGVMDWQTPSQQVANQMQGVIVLVLEHSRQRMYVAMVRALTTSWPSSGEDQINRNARAYPWFWKFWRTCCLSHHSVENNGGPLEPSFVGYSRSSTSAVANVPNDGHNFRRMTLQGSLFTTDFPVSASRGRKNPDGGLLATRLV